MSQFKVTMKGGAVITVEVSARDAHRKTESQVLKIAMFLASTYMGEPAVKAVPSSEHT